MSSAFVTSTTRVLLSRLAREYLRPYKPTLIWAVICMAVAASTTAGMAKLMQPIVDDVFQDKRPDALFWVSAAVMGVFVLRGLSTYGHNVLMNHVGQKVTAALQVQVFSHLMGADLGFFHATSSGRLISALVNDVSVMRNAFAECLTDIGRHTLTLIFLVSLTFYQDWRLALFTFTAFPPAIVFMVRLGRRTRRLSNRSQEELGTFSAILSQVFQGVRYVKAYGMEKYEESRIQEITNRLFALARKTAKAAAGYSSLTELLSGAIISLLVIYCGHQVIMGVRTAGAFFSFVTAFLLAYEPMKNLSKLNVRLQIGLAATERVFKLLDTPPSLTDKPSARDLSATRFDIVLEGVTFSYTPAVKTLDNVSLTVPAGKRIALVGLSGSGKSTIINLILRFYDAEEGRVMVGGADVRDLKIASLRSHIALVSQEVSLFDDTILANIAYGRPNARKEDIVAVAKNAAAHDFIQALPQGYETRVGENGVRLSGGQRQRIAIARAMLRNAPILLLDEATSALDTESERAVQGALATLQKGRTTLVIAHRLSTVVDADKIYVMDQGQILEQGTHAQLLEKSGLYSRLYGGVLGSTI